MTMKSESPISLWEARVLQRTERVQLSPEDLGFVSVGHTVTSAVLPPGRPHPDRRTGILWGIGDGIVAGQRWLMAAAPLGCAARSPGHSVVPSSGTASPLLRARSPRPGCPASPCPACPPREGLWALHRAVVKVSRDFPRTW